MVLDHQGYLPSYAVITQGKVPDLLMARSLRFPEGSIVVFDRGYVDYRWYEELTQQGVFFVTRMRHDAHYRVVEKRDVPQNRSIVSDEIIELGSHMYQQQSRLRRIEVCVPDWSETLVLLTDHLAFGATTAASIYKERWQWEPAPMPLSSRFGPR